MKKLVILFSLIFTTQLLFSQIKDTISNKSDFQSYTNSNGEIFTYKKPRFFEMITRIPRNVYGTIQDFGVKENLIALGGATVLTVALLPADQYLLDNSNNFSAFSSISFLQYNLSSHFSGIPSSP